MSDDAVPTEANAPSVFQTLHVEPAHAGKRLDRFLVDAVPELSRARVKTMIEEGQVRVNGRRARKGDAVADGATVELLAPPPPKDFSPVPQKDGSLVLRFEDHHLAVADKPAGMPTHPLRPEETGTLANLLIGRFPETKDIGFARREPGLLHRLDTETSGLVLVARTQDAFDFLREATREGKVKKSYIALVEGLVTGEGRVEYPLVPHRKDPKRVEAVTPHVRLRAGTRTYDAKTRYKPLKAVKIDGADYTVVRVELESAFRHQVRVHMATAGHALAGDLLYRGPELPAKYKLERHFLHACEVVFPHPKDGKELTVRSPLPAELASVLEALGARDAWA